MIELEKFVASVAEKSLSGFAFSQAILEDYAAVISKIEGCEAESIKERITIKATEIYNKHKAILYG